MTTIKHNKIKNTEFLFECLSRQVTSDILNDVKDSPALKIIKEHFKKGSVLNQELELYKALSSKSITETNKIDYLVDSVGKLRKKISNRELRNAKYNIVKAIKEHYDVNQIFKTRIKDYKTVASIYKFFESLSTEIQPLEETNIRFNMIENLTILPTQGKKKNKFESFSKQDADIRLLAYKMLVDKFNSKYSTLTESQRNLLKQYINNISNTNSFKEYIISEVSEIQKELKSYLPKIDDNVVKIKLKEAIKISDNYKKGQVVKDSQVVGMMRFYKLIDEIRNVVK
tara:strand:- start:860 stop:1714 length:855 start_codon:yes stop_codon:yes gene_type:complete